MVGGAATVLAGGRHTSSEEAKLEEIISPSKRKVLSKEQVRRRYNIISVPIVPITDDEVVKVKALSSISSLSLQGSLSSFSSSSLTSDLLPLLVIVCGVGSSVTFCFTGCLRIKATLTYAKEPSMVGL